MIRVSPSPLARALGELSPETLVFVRRALSAGRPGMAAPDGPADELQVAGIIELAKDGISEFPYRIPVQTWQRLHELRPIVDALAGDGRTSPDAIAHLEAKIDARLAAERDTGGPLGLVIGVLVFVVRTLAHAPLLGIRAWRRNERRVFIDDRVPGAHELEKIQIDRPHSNDSDGFDDSSRPLE